MTDLSKEIMEKANGGLKLNPDEQRRFLGTFEERVLGYADLKQAIVLSFRRAFLKVLKSLNEQASPLFVKISPNVDSSVQLSYLKQAKEFGCQATIVSEEHDSSFWARDSYRCTSDHYSQGPPNCFFRISGRKKKKPTKPSLWKKNGLVDQSCPLDILLVLNIRWKKAV